MTFCDEDLLLFDLPSPQIVPSFIRQSLVSPLFLRIQ